MRPKFDHLVIETCRAYLINTKSSEMQWAGKSALLDADKIMGAALDKNDCNMGEVFDFFLVTLYDCG